MLLADGAVAAGSGPNQESPLPSLPDALRRLTDVGGWRSSLEQAGWQFTFTYYGDAFGNPSGGVKQSLGYDGRFGVIVDADLAKLIGWTGGKFHASAHWIHGTQFSTINLQNLAVVSSIEAPGSTRLFNLWFEQKFGDTVSLRLGQFAVGQTFMVSETAGLFVNAAFGWPVLPGTDLPSGSPAYPVATPGVRLAWTPNDQLTVRAAIFNGDPAGPGTQNPVFRDPYGVSFRLNDAPLLIGEVAYAYNQDKATDKEQPGQEGTGSQRPHRTFTSRGAAAAGLPGTVKVGAWLHTGQFADQRFNSQGGLLADSSTFPLMHAWNVAVYGVIDQMLWRSGERELSGFLRAVATPSDRNAMSFYLDAGLTYQGLLDWRPDDTVGIAVSYNRISPLAAAYDRDVAIATATAMPIRSYETAIELTYQIQLAETWSVQPNLQYIIYPGGHVPNPLDPSGTSAIPNAFVVGLRTSLRF
jgi:porin